MKVCLSCGRENADDARFCSQCATPLTGDAARAREERKVVTCLFCDLVGFTARAEKLDPEDVRRILQPYHTQVRTELERFGGTVEKFIGDAVMAVFGAPVAHEDDPERAVRAALSIRDTLVEEGELEVRIGITTGEALVALGARPEAGEGMASGDVVNTAARLQTAAPTNGILVDETTFRATERAIEYGESTTIEAKGKAEPVPVWGAQRARSRVSVERVGGAQLVGREQELTLLRESLARVIRERQPQLVTLVGVPGIGKSRLTFELFETIETGDHGLVYWRHGRSLPYGEGVTFWALGEMVKAQAGILESDSTDQAANTLRRSVEQFVDDPADAGWIERHLRPLAGLDAEESSGDRRQESFAAWRRFLEAIADERPLVLVFDDLHWADDALLDFVDYLLDWAIGVPILALATARPELLTRRPGWGGGKVNSSTIQLSPLSEEETTTLVHALLGRSALDAQLQTHLLEHAGGNPLYAEEFTRMLASRPGEAILPETVQGIIAARLDTLPTEEKELLQDAAVVGRIFWLGALGGERWTLEERLHSLVRTEFISRQRRSTVAGEDEYSFRHALVRDVAYEQIPRARRAEKHRATAEWIESLGRPEDHAEMVAHHYAEALELARSVGESTEALDEAAGHAFSVAGDRAFSLNAFAAAATFYGAALSLGCADGERAAELLFRRARAVFVLDDPDREAALEHARAALLATGDLERAAEAEALLAEHAWYLAQRDRSAAHLTRAQEMVEDLPASAGKAQVLSQVSRYRMLDGLYDEAVDIAEVALSMAEELGLAEIQAHALINLGTARINLGELKGLEDIERGIEIASPLRSPEAARGYNNLAAVTWGRGDVQRGLALFEEAISASEALGNVSLARFSTAMGAQMLFHTGKWDEALFRADELIATREAGEPQYYESAIRMTRARVRLGRDDVAGALDDAARAIPAARSAANPQALVTGLVTAARLYAEAGQVEQATAVAHEALSLDPVIWAIPQLAWVADALDRREEVTGWIGRFPMTTRWHDAAEALLRRDFLAAAAVFREIDALDEEALARGRAAEQLAVAGRIDEADEQLELALAFWRSVDATRYIREAEALRGDASEISA